MSTEQQIPAVLKPIKDNWNKNPTPLQVPWRPQ